MTKKKTKAEEMAQVAIPATQHIEEMLVKKTTGESGLPSRGLRALATD